MKLRTISNLVLLGASSTAALGNIVVNAGFEDPPVGYGVYTTYSFGETIGSGWEVDMGDVHLVDEYWWAANSGIQSLDMDGGVRGGIHQDLATSAGSAYNFSFWMSGNLYNGIGPKTMDVYWDGGFVGSYSFTDSTTDIAHPRWDFHGLYGLVASSSMTRIRFVSTNEFYEGWGPAVDDVSVELVPEPSSLMILTMSGIALLRKRRG